MLVPRLFLFFVLVAFTTYGSQDMDADGGCDSSLRKATSFSVLELSVNTRSIFLFHDVFGEAGRLADLIVSHILGTLSQLEMDQEILIASVGGLAGLGKIEEFQSSEARASSDMCDTLPALILSELTARGVKAARIWEKGEKPHERDAEILIRQFLVHDEKSYGPDFGRDTWSYQRSIFQYWVLKRHVKKRPWYQFW